MQARAVNRRLGERPRIVPELWEIRPWPVFRSEFLQKPSHDLASYAGTYHDDAYGDATVTLENGALVLRWSRISIPLAHYHFDTFSAISEADDVDEQVQFQLGPDGNVKSMTAFGEEFVKK